MQAPTQWQHEPVALTTIKRLIEPAIKQNIRSLNLFGIDATFGLGGHSEAILKEYPGLRILGIDRDKEAIDRWKEANPNSQNIELKYATYDNIANLAKEYSAEDKPVFILFDLGVSSPQLDNDYRGFSYSRISPLDMRMNQASDLTAEMIVNEYSEEQLITIFKQYGQERFAYSIAKNIIKERDKHKIATSAELVEIIYDSIPAPARRVGGHPAKRVFQALRVEVNDELNILNKAIPAALEIIAPGGRVIVMSYQSGEDTIVKNFFKEVTESNTLLDLPVIEQNNSAKFKLVRPKLIKASAEEIEKNSRAKSVRIRAIEKLGK